MTIGSMDFGSGKKKSGIEHEHEVKEAHAYPQELVEYESSVQQQPQVIYVENPNQQKKGGCLRTVGIVFAVLLGLSFLTSLGANATRNRNSTTSEQSRQSSVPITKNEEKVSKSLQDDTNASEPVQESTQEQVQQEQQQEVVTDTSYGEGRDFAISIDDAHLGENYDGSPCVVVNYTFTNLSDERGQSFMWTIRDKVYQNGVECEQAFFAESDNDNASKDLKPGVSVPVSVAYKLVDTTTPVEVEIFKSSFSSEVLAVRTFTL